MSSTNKSLLIFALVSSVFCSTVFSSSSNTFFPDAYRRHRKPVKHCTTKLDYFDHKEQKNGAFQEKDIATQSDDIVGKKTSPLTPAERKSNDIKNAAKGAAIGGAVGGAGCAVANAYVLIHNSFVSTTTAVMAFPGLAPMYPLVAVGLLIGGLHGYGTGE